jgi:hypothetical protein
MAEREAVELTPHDGELEREAVRAGGGSGVQGVLRVIGQLSSISSRPTIFLLSLASERGSKSGCLIFMNSRLLVPGTALLLAIIMYLALRSTNRDNAELSARVAQVEEQVQRVKSASAEEQLRTENGRLRAENQRLKGLLAQFTGTPAGPLARVSHQQEPPYDPLAFYRRNPELMRRYFPQLYKEEMAKQQKADEVPAPPKE